MKSEKKILWPFDPYVEDKEGDEKVIQFLKNLTKSYELEVTPVFVSSSNFVQYSQFIKPSDIEKMQSYIKKDCTKHLNQLATDIKLSDVVVLDNSYSSQSSEVLQFEKFAEAENPHFLVMSSHGRKGWSRAFLGSFTESLLRRTDIPTFVINAKMNCAKDLTKAMLPVETDEKSQKFIEFFLDQHSLSFVSSLELFHKLTLSDYDNYEWMPTLYSSNGYNGLEIIEESKKRATEFLAAFLEHPLSQKRLAYNVSDDIGPVSDAINKRAEVSNHGFVIIQSQAGPVARRMLGSFTQDVMRNSQVPVLVYPFHYQSTREQ